MFTLGSVELAGKTGSLLAQAAGLILKFCFEGFIHQMVLGEFGGELVLALVVGIPQGSKKWHGQPCEPTKPSFSCGGGLGLSRLIGWSGRNCSSYRW